MAKTSPRVTFGLFALDVKPDSIPSTPAVLQPFSKLADLVTDDATSLPYATYEPDFWLLDGGYKFLPPALATVHVGLMSAVMSDANGNFAVPPVLTIDFSAAHTSDGLTLHFSGYTGDWASAITIAYYDAASSLIRSDNYNPTSADFSTGQGVTAFKRILITFSSTNRPYRYLRLSGIDYGQIVTFEGSQIKAATVVEEISLLSADARYNTLDLRLYSADGGFSIVNPTGYYAYLQERQAIAVYEQVDNQSVYMGQFYMDQWENKSETEIEFRCVDLLGVLDKITYNGGLWSGAGIALPTLLAAILGPIHAPFDLDASLSGVSVIGWIPICSYRQALQQIAIAVGAYVDCGRSGAIKIYKTPIASASVASAAITKADKGMDQSISLRPQVTGVEVTAHNYVATSTSTQLYSGTLAAGTHEITFNAPMHDLSVSGATITDSGVNYAVLSVAVTGSVTLSGQTYTDTTQVYSLTNGALPATAKPNMLKITDATLVHLGNMAAVAQLVYDYYQQRYLQKVKLYAPTAYAPGDVVLIDTLYNQQLRCTVEKMSADLAAGFMVQAEMTGVVN
jgi:hypothetical protein